MRIIAAVGIALVVAASAASAAPQSSSVWTRVSGPTRASTQLGLLNAGGILHVVSAQGSPATITDTQLNAGRVSRTLTVGSNFDAAGGLSLVGMADGSVRLFVSGGSRPGLPSNLSGINSFVLPVGAAAWQFDPPALWGGAVAAASSYISGALLGNSQPVTAWSGGIVHVGLQPSPGADPSYQPDCCGAAPELATDGGTGGVVMSWLSNGHESGTYVQQVLPTAGARVSLPSGLTEGSSGIAARIGAPGTFVAYTGPTNQVRLYEYGGKTAVVAHGAFRVAKVFAAPEGRLWMLWGDANSGVYATRSNKAVTQWEPIRHLALPANLTAFYNAQGDGSAGPLDAFVDLLIGADDRGFWRTHILPKDSLTASLSYPTGGGHARTEKVSFRVTDAGDPVKGAIIVVARGGKKLLNLRTGADGRASGSFTGGVKLTATASVPGYDNAIITVG